MHQQTTAHNKTCINTLFAFTSCSSVASSNSYSSTIAIVTLNLILWWIDVKDTKKNTFLFIHASGVEVKIGRKN